MHEFYHIIFEHVTTRKPEAGIRQIDNIAMDLSINGLSEMHGKLPCEASPGPILREGGEPMKGCLPGEGKFADLPANQTYEWYLAALEKMKEESEANGEGDPFGDEDSFDVHDGFGEGGGNDAANEIAKERMKEAIRKAAEEADKAGNWGSVSQSMKKTIKERLQTKVDWKKMLRYFVRTSQRADKRSTPRRLNKRFPKIHPGKRVRRQAKIAISIDQSVLWTMGCWLLSTLSWTTSLSLLSSPSSPLIPALPRTRFMSGRRASAVRLSVCCTAERTFVRRLGM